MISVIIDLLGYVPAVMLLCAAAGLFIVLYACALFLLPEFLTGADIVQTAKNGRARSEFNLRKGSDGWRLVWLAVFMGYASYEDFGTPLAEPQDPEYRDGREIRLHIRYFHFTPAGLAVRQDKNGLAFWLNTAWRVGRAMALAVPAAGWIFIRQKFLSP